MKVELGWTGEARYLLQGGRSAPGGGGGVHERPKQGTPGTQTFQKGGGGEPGQRTEASGSSPGARLSSSRAARRPHAPARISC